jgi:hypothetical protein
MFLNLPDTFEPFDGLNAGFRDIPKNATKIMKFIFVVFYNTGTVGLDQCQSCFETGILSR